jgi:hypothetical protein
MDHAQPRQYPPESKHPSQGLGHSTGTALGQLLMQLRESLPHLTLTPLVFSQ